MGHNERTIRVEFKNETTKQLLCKKTIVFEKIENDPFLCTGNLLKFSSPKD